MTVLRDYAAAVSQATLPFTVPSPASEGLALDSPSRYDEVVAPDGGLRPAWKALAGSALSLTPEELHRVDGRLIPPAVMVTDKAYIC